MTRAALGWGSGPLVYHGKKEELDSLQALSHSSREAQSQSQHALKWKQQGSSSDTDVVYVFVINRLTFHKVTCIHLGVFQNEKRKHLDAVPN